MCSVHEPTTAFCHDPTIVGNRVNPELERVGMQYFYQASLLDFEVVCMIGEAMAGVGIVDFELIKDY